MKRGFRALLTLGGFAFAVLLPASEFYTAPNGTAGGDGSKTRPWDLATALAQPPAVKPGDTIWLQGGTYVGAFTSVLTGAPRKPIVLRQADGERATIDGNYGGSQATLTINGSNAWYWGFEITNSATDRTSPSADNPPHRGDGVDIFGANTRLINLAIHDTAQGVLFSTPAVDSEIYGCLIYFNGYDAPDRGHGHGIYVQNDTGKKSMRDNILFDQFGYGVHAYTQGARLNNLDIEGNFSFNNGAPSRVSGQSTNFLIGASGSAATGPFSSDKVAHNTVFKENISYFSASGGSAANLGYSKGIASPTIVGNYLVGGFALQLVNAFRPITLTGNTLVGSLDGFAAGDYPDNTYATGTPSGTRTFVRQNAYEKGRANIAIYNWDRASSVSVDVSGVLKPGIPYELRNAQDFYGPIILKGTYSGAPLVIPMATNATSSPVGWTPSPSTGPVFQAFVLTSKERPTPRGGVVRPGDHHETLAVPPFPLGHTDRVGTEPPESYLAGVVSRHAFEGTDEISELSIANDAARPARVRVTFLEHDHDNVSAPSATISVAPDEALHIEDPLATLFAVTDTYGVLLIETTGRQRLTVSIRRREEDPADGEENDEATDPTEEAVRAVPAADHPVLFSGGRLSLQTVRLLNPGVSPAEVSVALRAGRFVIATTTLSLPARGYVQQKLTHLFPQFAITDQEGVELEVLSDASPSVLAAVVLEPHSDASVPPP